MLAAEYARDEHLHPDRAHNHIYDSFRKGTDYHILWTAVAEGRVTTNQAYTITTSAERLSARIAVVREVITPTGEITLDADEGDPLFDAPTLRRVRDEFLTTAVEHAVHGHTGRKLTYRLDRDLRELTPGYEPVVITRNTTTVGVHLDACEDGVNASIGWLMPLADALRFVAHVTALADATADAERAAGMYDDRTHGQRQCDAATDLVNDALTRHVPATTGRTHRPCSSTQVHVRIDATTLLGLDHYPAWIDGLGSVPAEVARQLATDTGALWRTVVQSPGNRSVLDIGSDAYPITAAMRRFITDRDVTCAPPDARSPPSIATSTTSSPTPRARPPSPTSSPDAAAATARRPSTSTKTPNNANFACTDHRRSLRTHHRPSDLGTRPEDPPPAPSAAQNSGGIPSARGPRAVVARSSRGRRPPKGDRLDAGVAIGGSRGGRGTLRPRSHPFVDSEPRAEPRNPSQVQPARVRRSGRQHPANSAPGTC